MKSGQEFNLFMWYYPYNDIFQFRNCQKYANTSLCLTITKGTELSEFSYKNLINTDILVLSYEE